MCLYWRLFYFRLRLIRIVNPIQNTIDTTATLNTRREEALMRRMVDGA